MAGASESNDDLVSGRVNRANHLTRIWAENGHHDIGPGGVIGSFRVDFAGDVIFLVEAALDTEEDGEFKPPAKLDAIVGKGWSAKDAGGSGGIGVVGIGGEVAGLGVRGIGGENGRGVVGDAGGQATGVSGLGGPNEGTGVFGLGSGGDRASPPRRGSGGIGVRGEGGRADLRPGQPPVSPGVGVLGQGGKVPTSNEGRALLGTGVIGMGGAAGDNTLPAAKDAGSVGVFGQGAEARVTKIFDGGTAILDGPLEPGAGVIGLGGLPNPPEMPVAAGVIGLAGGQSKPPLDITGNVGVFGLGPTGVRGRGDGGPGVYGISNKDRGGVFESARVAQARLVPKKVETRLPEGSPVTPTGIDPGSLQRGVVSLPKNGAAGDLMTLLDDEEQCTLWFCVRSASSAGPARWAQVLLGTAFDGQSS